jgi:RNase H-fold protein (predicted Holliday junction resolvase)
MTRWLGIDLGEKRVGLAVADGDVADAIARPLQTLRRGRDLPLGLTFSADGRESIGNGAFTANVEQLGFNPERI